MPVLPRNRHTGINMDAEAANLIEQQQAYQASARVLATARELFGTLIRVFEVGYYDISTRLSVNRPLQFSRITSNSAGTG